MQASSKTEKGIVVIVALVVALIVAQIIRYVTKD